MVPYLIMTPIPRYTYLGIRAINMIKNFLKCLNTCCMRENVYGIGFRASLVCWSLTSLCHSNGHIETMPAREINPFTALTRIRSQFLRTQWSTSNHQRMDMTTPQTAQPLGLTVSVLDHRLSQNSCLNTALAFLALNRTHNTPTVHLDKKYLSYTK